MNGRSRFPIRFVPYSLRFKLLLRTVLILAGLLTLMGILQYVFMQQFLYQNKASSIVSLIRSIPYQVWEQWISGRLEERPDNVPVRTLQSPGMTVAFVNRDGIITEIQRDMRRSLEVPKLPEEEYREILDSGKRPDDYFIVRNKGEKAQLVVLQRVGPRNQVQGLIQVSTDLTELHTVLRLELLIYVIGALVALVVGVLLFQPVIRRTLSPLSRMVETVERINAGNLSERLKDRQGSLEIDRLSASFNGMLERLETSFAAEKEAKEHMRRFIADASHELRTPLTSIHGFLEVLLRGPAIQPDQLRKALYSMYGESERLNKLVEDLLLLAKLDRKPDVQFQAGKLGELIRSIEPQLRLIAEARRIQFDLHDDAEIVFDPDRMKQVILNLFQNAVQHTTRQEGKIHIDLKRQDGGMLLSVRDNGPGIDEEQMPHLFERFYRGDRSRTRKYGGAGLGLSIVKSIVELHGGYVLVESKKGKGATFRVWLPGCPTVAAQRSH